MFIVVKEDSMHNHPISKSFLIATPNKLIYHLHTRGYKSGSVVSTPTYPAVYPSNSSLRVHFPRI